MKIGIIGGGQLARMLILAGYPLGLDFAVLDPAPDACAGPLAEHLVAPYDDPEALARLADTCQVITYEFENVSLEGLSRLQDRARIHPPLTALAESRDRLQEKSLFRSLDIPTPPFVAIDSREDLAEAPKCLGWPFLVKTRRFGYDGKGQFLIRTAADMDAAWAELAGRPLIGEGFIPFDREVSVIAVRRASGETAFYPLSENVHKSGILHLARCRPGDAAAAQAQEYARRLLERLDYVGVLALELFEVNGRLLANEMAPRVHNSGHWTIEGAEVSQFENHLRAILDLPLGGTEPVGHTAMVNFIGVLPALADVLAQPGVHCHFYGKAERPGRKVGHATVRAASAKALEARLHHLLALLP
ncbi:5-(carboxyamino)imidazole ribonucleotide synthase [Methylomarinovum tepidoasis]|uniref:N5-carboxyaminoimidazole ribonucleotide synthase n=1 Tax=Methylomarinovum tepidoasis TaxID=2840183 RepID=A0AAU9CL48_9GAMM|nr:5-(carboxyamino)imidazole ribonucleotide synthase [Methylomarinovum sp. IN45]BCX88357.1 5-(carboxyamino)imidazole ribonucleotide synthase [Methylomarinovum sp. IN45]